MEKRVLTLCILHQKNRVLLGMKKRGFGEGKWNGFGGKVEEGETIEEATIRETEEEAGVTVANLKAHGVLEFRFLEKPDEILEVHIFGTRDYTGTPTESEEMRPVWYKVDDIPYDDMWPDDIYWLPELLKGKCFEGTFFFGKDGGIVENTFSLVRCAEVTTNS